jgi:hypothetical protein
MNFDNVADKSAGFVQPGTIDVFKIVETEVAKAKTGTDQLVATFKNEDGESYKHYFAWTEKAAVNINHLVKNATGAGLSGDVQLNAIAAQLKGRKVALKITGKISQNGKGYADLPFGSFAAPADQKDSLSFTAGEQTKIENARNATGSASGADGETAAPTASDNDEF